MTAEAVESGKLDIARVIQQTFAVLGRNFLTFFLLALILSGLPSAVLSFVEASAFQGGGSGTAVLSALVGSLLAVVTASVLQGALVYGTVQDLNGARASVGDSLATGLRAFLPLLVVSILFALAVAVGVVLLVVPGVMIACAWSVAVPALVAERTRLRDAFGRSADLTRGNRWRIFALFIFVGLAIVVISAISGALIAATGLTGVRVEENQALAPAAIILGTLAETIGTLIGATGISVLYVELRKAREGVGPQWLADIFS
jgi:hypothetical protein